MKPMWKINDVSLRTNLRESTIRYLIYRNKIPFFRLGRAIRFEPEKIESWIKQQEARK